MKSRIKRLLPLFILVVALVSFPGIANAKAYKITSAKLKSTTATYTGKAVKPKVSSVKAKVNGKTKTLRSGKDYSVSYKNNKKIGKAKAVIKGKGSYTGSVTCNFKIVPKGTGIKSLTATGNSITVKWNKQSAQTSGYELQYSLEPAFKKGKTITVSKTGTTSKTITGLLTGREYYVRIRTYKALKDGKYCSSWSAKKTVSTTAPKPGKNTKVGALISFGKYEQDNKKPNGKENIVWRVLAKDAVNNRILVISEYGLDQQVYDPREADVTWETCALRKWLDNDFKKAAFNATEQSRIPRVTVKADENPYHKKTSSAGNDTKDQVFLLSIVEAKKYFTSDKDRRCAPTAYAGARGVMRSDEDEEPENCTTADGRYTCRWTLRSPGYENQDAASVSESGSVGEQDYWAIRCPDVAIRPAMWIKL